MAKEHTSALIVGRSHIGCPYPNRPKRKEKQNEQKKKCFEKIKRKAFDNENKLL
jgi:hypothetical protein